MKNLFFLIFIHLFLNLSYAQQTPAESQKEIITIKGAVAHIGNGERIENSMLILEKGKIKAVGASGAMTEEGTVIDASGKHIYPGFIATNTTLGLIEIDAVRATRDNQEIGTFNPHIRSIIAYNAESKIVETMRPNGVLTAQVVPRGGRISGTSSVVQLDAWNWEDAIVKENDGIHLNWPSPFTRGKWWLGEDPGLKPNKKYAEQVNELSTYFNKAKAYSANPKKTHLPFEAMRGVFSGDQIVFIHADHEKAILDMISFSIKQNILSKVVLVGGYHAYKLIDDLKQNNISVLLTRTHSLPKFEDDDYDLPYKQAVMLSKSGILVALQNSGDMERANTRNLPFQAGTVAAYGLDKEKALQLITENPAKILGIEDRLGTLTVGKDATLFISIGDALDMRTNQLEKAFIQGREISLETHQTELWKRYSEKYQKQSTGN